MQFFSVRPDLPSTNNFHRFAQQVKWAVSAKHPNGTQSERIDYQLLIRRWHHQKNLRFRVGPSDLGQYPKAAQRPVLQIGTNDGDLRSTLLKYS
jgi:hypothetical protein